MTLSERSEKYDLLVVGAGMTGLTIARRAADDGQRVLVVERRDHIAGNCFDELDKHGVLVHRYGPHVFHTASRAVYEFLGRFTAWRPYEHRVVAWLPQNAHGQPLGYVPMPINARTLELFYGVELADEEAARSFLEEIREPVDRPTNSEEVVVDKIGRPLFEAIFEPYTTKQWGRAPRDLDRAVCARIPIRTDRDDRYFDDPYQVMPAEGYTAMFARMCEHDLIDVQLSADGAEALGAAPRTVWTGCLDEAFDYALGRLPWRSLEFKLQTIRTPEGACAQPAAVVNHPSANVPYTRKTEYRWLTGQRHTMSTVHVEYPSDTGEPYYPVPAPASQRLAKEYRELAAESDLVVAGRLGRYQYLEMGQACAGALALYERELAPEPTRPK